MSAAKASMGLVILTFFLSLMWMIVPLPEGWAMYRPNLAMLVLIYWVYHCPHRIGVAAGWFVGLLMDVLVGGVLGEYALGMALIAYFTYRLHERMRMYPLFQQMFTIMVLVGLAQVLVVWVNYLTGDPYKFYLQWIPILTTTACWPFMCLLLQRVNDE
jgi:rod shape-determining protein MreD